MDTAHLAILGGATLTLITIAWWIARRLTRRRLPYTKRPSLLTAGELRFYRVLLKALPPGMEVFVKVRLMDLVSVPDHDWREYGAPCSGMHVDFVLADAPTLEPRLVIELDDSSHARPEAKDRDAFKDAALAAAGIPLLMVVVTGRYDRAALRAKIQKIMRASVR
jgi:hypothetical protein